MEKYENLGMVGEGSYGMVMKCKHKETKQLVAIKKFIESEEDRMVSKIAKREVKMLQSLRHVNLVNLLEVFRKKKRLYLVFEYVERTVLDDLEKHPMGLSFQQVCGLTWQVMNGVQFIHSNSIIHRDIKPENVLISAGGVVKLCDFGFARFIAGPNEKYTDYVATRWYRAPELLVGDVHYDKGVDIWATGCLISEMLTGEPLFPGDSDIDQIYHITKCLGNLITRHREIFSRNPLFQGVRLPTVRRITSFEKRYPKMKPHALSMIKLCLKLDPKERPGCDMLLEEEFFSHDSEFIPKFKKKLSTQMFSFFVFTLHYHTVAPLPHHTEILVLLHHYNDCLLHKSTVAYFLFILVMIRCLVMIFVICCVKFSVSFSLSQHLIKRSKNIHNYPVCLRQCYQRHRG